MEQKKNPQADLNKKRSLFFIAGLLLVLSLVYVALEWKTYDDTSAYDLSMNVQEELLEAVPFVQLKTPPPPPPQVTPEIIEVVEDDEPIVETVIESTETDQEEEVAKVEDIVVVEDPIDLDVPFAIIEDVPVFPGCENASDKRICFQKMMQKHISKVFKYPEAAQEMGIQGKVYTTFVIQQDGSIGGIRMRGPDKLLEKEAARIIDKLPKMTPGKQRGTPVRVPFSIPITFRLQ